MSSWHPWFQLLAFQLIPSRKISFPAVEDSLKFITHMLKYWCICFCACYLDDWNVLQWCSYQPCSAGLPRRRKYTGRLPRFLDMLLDAEQQLKARNYKHPKAQSLYSLPSHWLPSPPPNSTSEMNTNIFITDVWRMKTK